MLSLQGPAGYKGMVGSIGAAGRPVGAPFTPGCSGITLCPAQSSFSSLLQGREGPKGPPGDPGDKGELVGDTPSAGVPFSPAWGALQGHLCPLHRQDTGTCPLLL